MTKEQQVIQITEYYAHKIVAPQSWVKVLFSDVCKIIGGSQPPKECFVNEPQDGYIRLIQIRDYKTDKFATYIPIKMAKRLCNKDDIMIGRYGPPIFQILRGLDGAYNVALMKVIPNLQLVDKEFLYYFLQTPNLFNYVAAASLRTAGQDGVRKEHLDNYPLFIPSLSEQRRIVAKIEALRAKSQRVKEALEAIPPLLNQFRRSVLAAAFRGDLTADWREKNPDVEPASKVVENILSRRINQANTPIQLQKINEIYSYQEEENENSLPEIWRYVTLEKLCNSFQYGTSAKSMPSGQVIVLRMGNIQNGQIDWNDLVYTSNEEEIKKYKLQSGDVLFNRTNSPELVGKTGIYRGERAAIFAGYLIKVNNLPELNSEYLNYCLNTSYAKDYCWRVKTDGVSQSNINAQKLGKFEIPFCSIEEQKEIVRRVKSLLEASDRIKQQYQEAKAYLYQLDQSILAKAFRGELVPQDPNDELASVLLERIRAERTKLQVSAKTAKKSTGKTGGQRREKPKQQDVESVQLELPVSE